MAQDAPKPDDAKAASASTRHSDKVAQELADAWGSAPAKEQESVTAHSVVAAGRTLRYHATAGTVTIKDDDAKPTASVFYVAYTLDGAPPGTRPVTFLYNGGPGSASVWLQRRRARPRHEPPN